MIGTNQWYQTMLCRPDDDRDTLYEIMEKSLIRRAKERGDAVIGHPVREELAVGIAHKLYEGIDPNDMILGVYITTARVATKAHA